MNKSKILRGLLIAAGASLCIGLIYLGGWYYVLTMPPRRLDMALTQLTNGLATAELKPGQWYVSFRCQTLDEHALKTPVRCRLKNTGKGPDLLVQTLPERDLPNGGYLKSGKEITVYDGELGPLLQGPATLLIYRLDSAHLELEFPKEFNLTAPLSLRLDEFVLPL